MLSQLVKRSIRGLVSGLSKAAVCFLKISTLAFGFGSNLFKKSVYFLLQQEYNQGGISESAHCFRMFDYFSLGNSIKIGRKCKLKQHNGLLSLLRYTFPALIKFCSIEIAFRERQISYFILICWFIVSEVDHAIRMLCN